MIVILPFGLVQGATTVNGIISSDTTWTQAGSPYTLTGNVLVETGVTLTIDAGTTVNLGSYYIMVNGTLAAKGTTASPITLNGGSITFTSKSAGWNEQTQSGCIIENAVLTAALTTENTVKINSNTINSAITANNDTMITSNNINGNINGGIISGNTIVGEVNSDNIHNNIITGNVGCTGNASNNIIKGGMEVDGNCLVTNNTIIGGLTNRETNEGILLTSHYVYGGGYPKIENNTITNSTVGISIGILIRAWFSTNIPEIRNNLITQNDVGIQYTISRQELYSTRQTIIENNTIAQNGIGIKFIYATDEYQIINNNIQDNAQYNIYLETTYNEVNVTGNWWGTADQTEIANAIYDYYKDFNLGKVSYTPFLAEANSQTPIIPESPTIILLTLLLAATILASVCLQKKKQPR